MGELFFLYYWHTTRLNLALSFLIALLSLSPVSGIFCFGTLGILASFIGYRYLQNLQYLFYLNAGYSKKQLMFSTAAINIVLATVTLLIISIF